MFLSDKSLKALLCIIPHDSEMIDNLQYQREGSVPKETWAKKMLQFPWIKWNCVQSTFCKHRQCLPDFTTRMRTDVTEGFGDFFSKILQRTQTLFLMQRDIIGLRVRMESDAVDVFNLL